MSEENGTGIPRVFYRIRDWQTKFENNRSREVKSLDWVRFPNPLIEGGGDGYAELMNHPDGAAHFGFWCACVFLAARSQERGTLLRPSGAPHCASSIAVTCRIPAVTCGDAAARLVSLGWLIELPFTKHNLYQTARTSQEGARTSQVKPTAPQEGAASRRARGVEKRREENTPPGPPSSEGGNHQTSSGPEPPRRRRGVSKAEQLEQYLYEQHKQGAL